MVTDVTEATFATEVLERSKQVPVVVDFWAEWCGPCRQLTPALEAAANAREGDVVLAKIDTDANPGISQSFQIQGIPAVKAFKDGRVIDEFTGAIPPKEVEAFFDKLVPSEADRLVATGDEASWRRALELQPGRADAAVPLASVLIARGERDEAEAVLGNTAGDFQAEGLRARLRLEDDPAAPDLADAWTALDAGQPERAADLVIAAIPASDVRKDDLRAVVVAILDELGPEHPFPREARRRLAQALY